MVFNYKLLDYKLKENNITNEQLANALNINVSTLYRKKRNDGDFTRKELQTIRNILNLTAKELDAIFFDEEYKG